MGTMVSTPDQVDAALELPWEPRALVRYRTHECRVRADGSAYEAESHGWLLVRAITNTVAVAVTASLLLAPLERLWGRSRAEVLADVFVDRAHEVSPEVRFEETWVAVGPGEVAVIAAARLPLSDGPATVAEVAWVGPVKEVRVDRRWAGRDRLRVFFPDRSMAVLPVARGTSLPT